MHNRPWLRCYDPPVPPSLAPYPDHTLDGFLKRSAAQFPDRACTIFKGRTVTYAEMEARSDRLAAALAGLGVKKGDRVGIFMPNTPQFVLAFYAILKAGGVVVAINPLYTAPELEHQLQDAGVEVMLVMSNFYPKVKASQKRTRLRTILVSNVKEELPPALAGLFTLFKEKKDGHRVTLEPGDYWLPNVLAASPPGRRPAVSVGPDDLALIQYTGGTTGLSKGAMASHRNLVANTIQLRRWLHQVRDGQEKTLMALPLFHVYGLVLGASLSIFGAAPLIMVPDPRDTRDLLRNLRKYRPTALPAVPTLYNAILAYPAVRAGRMDLSCLRICVSGSAALGLETRQAFERLSDCPMVEGYGLSEAPTVTHANPFDGPKPDNSIGLPLPDVDCRIVSLEDGVTPLPPGEIGELILRGPQVFTGYWNNPAETALALRPDPQDGQPWLYTGDVARMDDAGYFYIVDRKKEIIKAGGFQVLPSEVEAVLAQYPGIAQVCVAGVPDGYRGEAPKAWIVAQPGCSLSEAELRAFCADKLARYKIPTRFEFRQELPLSMIGKVLRRELVRQHLEQH